MPSDPGAPAAAAPGADPDTAPGAPPAAPLPGRVYRVGGSVRDERLGLPVTDCDWVVVGATPQAMLDAGFRAVGRDFPVFLHPQTHEEYALARTERKTGPGYRGFEMHFSPDVTLDEDLARRDLTINAMALDERGRPVDPHGGLADLQARVLRHVGPAFVEDPVRILRLARFAARFAQFSVAPETMALMQHMVRSGEADALVPERIWQEVSRGLMADTPSRMLDVLDACGALAAIAPELAGTANGALLDEAARRDAPLEVRHALLNTGLARAAVESLAHRWRVPVPCRDAALHAVSFGDAAVLAQPAPSPQATLDLLESLDALRRPQRLTGFLAQAAIVAGLPADAPRFRAIHAMARAAAAVDQGRIAAAQAPGRLDPQRLRHDIRCARLDAMQPVAVADAAPADATATAAATAPAVPAAPASPAPASPAPASVAPAPASASTASAATAPSPSP